MIGYIYIIDRMLDSQTTIKICLAMVVAFSIYKEIISFRLNLGRGGLLYILLVPRNQRTSPFGRDVQESGDTRCSFYFISLISGKKKSQLQHAGLDLVRNWFIIERKFKLWWSAIPLNHPNKQTNKQTRLTYKD